MDFLGEVLHIDLTNKNFRSEKLSKEDWIKFLPSRGINAKFLWDLTDEKTNPLGEDNVLIIGPGGLTSTGAPICGRTTITFKSPATNMYFKSNVGGILGDKIKKAGYSNIIIHGKSREPTYLYIDENEVVFKDASHVWGKDIRKTNQILLDDLGGKNLDFATIGPAGENLVKLSSIMFSTYTAAARGGGGAVMGSKNLKSIAVRGDKSKKIKKDNFIEACKKARDGVMNDSGFEGLSKYGTAGTVTPLNESFAWPTKNFQKSNFSNAYKISGEEIVESSRLKKKLFCHSCMVGCHRYTETKSSDFNGYGGGPELETIDSFGAGTMVDDLDAIIKANELCNIYGMDTISVGSVIQWAMECFDKGLISVDDTDGLELTWGNAEAMVKMVKKIAFRDGFGDLLAEGVKRASEKIGNESYKWAMEVKGLEQSGVDVRKALGYALAFAVNPRGADHLHTEAFAELGFSEEGRTLIKKITNDEFKEPVTTDYRAQIVRWHEDCFAVTDALGFCSFSTTALYGITPEIMAEMWSIAIDEKISAEELMEAGRRIVTLEKAYNIRCGADRSDDRLPWRIMNEDTGDRPNKNNLAVTQDKLDNMLDEYYMLHGWDLKTGWPDEKLYKKLDLEFVSNELKEMNKLPSREDLNATTKN